MLLFDSYTIAKVVIICCIAMLKLFFNKIPRPLRDDRGTGV